jgi:hypothetical protein
MAHFVACRKTTNAKELEELMLRNVWKLHGTPKTVFLDRGNIFISQITQELLRSTGSQQ